MEVGDKKLYDFKKNDEMINGMKPDDHKTKIYEGDTDIGLKFDQEKTMWQLVPWDCVKGVAEILTFGAKKYAPNSWQEIEEERYFGAMMRHWIAMQEGEKLDSESGMPHAYHFLTNAMFIAHKETRDV